MPNARSLTRRLATLIWVIGFGTVYSLYLRDWLSADMAQEQFSLPAPRVDLLVETVLNQPVDNFIDKTLG